MKAPENIRYLIPSGFLRKVNSVGDLWNEDELDVLMRVVGAEVADRGREGQKALARAILNRSRSLINGSYPGYDIKSVLLEPGAFQSITWASLPDKYLEEEYARKTKGRILDPWRNYRPLELMRVIESAGAVYFGGEEDHNTEPYGGSAGEGLHDGLTIPRSGVDSDDAVGYAKRKAGEYHFFAEGTWDGNTSFSPHLGQVVRITVKNINVVGTTISIRANREQIEEAILLPYIEYVFKFFKFGSEPMEWRFDVRTQSDVFDVKYKIESTWVPGMPPNR